MSANFISGPFLWSLVGEDITVAMPLKVLAVPVLCLSASRLP